MPEQKIESGRIATGAVTGDKIPVKYTCDGADISPPLSWIGIPGGTRSIAIIMEEYSNLFKNPSKIKQNFG